MVMQSTTEGCTFWRRRLACFGIGAAVLLLSAALVVDPPARWEETVFRALNDLPHNLEWFFWALQQLGSALVLPFAALALWRITRRWQPAVAVLATGFLLGWLAAKGIKAIVGRGRPEALLDDLFVGYDIPVGDVGFPSGHAVLAFTLAVVFVPYLSRRGRLIAFGLAIMVAFTRVYEGAHLPLDVIGGAGYGICIGTLVTALSAPRRPRLPSPRATPPTEQPPESGSEG
jgi:undecaprenyl-diphosphatase